MRVPVLLDTGQCSPSSWLVEEGDAMMADSKEGLGTRRRLLVVEGGRSGREVGREGGAGGRLHYSTT